MAAHQPSLFPIASSPALPPGFHYCAEAITHGDERRLWIRLRISPLRSSSSTVLKASVGLCRSAGGTISAATKSCRQFRFLRFCSTSTARFRPLRVSSFRTCSRSWSPSMVREPRSDGIKTGRCSATCWVCLSPPRAPFGSGNLLPRVVGSVPLFAWSRALPISLTARRGGSGNTAYLRWKNSGIPSPLETCGTPKTTQPRPNPRHRYVNPVSKCSYHSVGRVRCGTDHVATTIVA